MSATESTQTNAAGAQEDEDDSEDVRERNDRIRFSGCTPVCDRCDKAAYWIATHSSPQIRDEQLCSPDAHRVDQMTLDSINRLQLQLDE